MAEGQKKYKCSVCGVQYDEYADKCSVCGVIDNIVLNDKWSDTNQYMRNLANNYSSDKMIKDDNTAYNYSIIAENNDYETEKPFVCNKCGFQYKVLQSYCTNCRTYDCIVKNNKNSAVQVSSKAHKCENCGSILSESDDCCPYCDTPVRYINNDRHSAAQISSQIYGNVSNASTLYFEDKFATPRGHGFAAERANHLYDTYTGKNAQIVGDDNAKHDADRLVDGVNIQTKYCKTGSDCIKECFDDHQFKYYNPDGTPMQIEVPSDKYEAAVQAMEERIRRGEVKGVTDPEKAKEIVRKGHFTYEQVKNIAKAGTIESLTYDAANSAIVAAYSLGISSLISFATSIWNGDDFKVALKNSAVSGLKTFGTVFATGVLAGQLSKAGLNSLLVGSSEAIVRVMGPKASAVLVNAFRSGHNIYGAAAMKSAAKMLRGNMITGIASVVILSSVDVVNIFRGRISGAQLFKNVASTTASVAAGTGGWTGGAAAGAAIGSVVPFIGTAIGGVVGGLIGAGVAGVVAGKVTDKVIGVFVEDDADKMVKIIEEQFVQLAEDYLLVKKEVDNVTEGLQKTLTGKRLKDMFASDDREEYAREEFLLPLIEAEISQRQHISLPSEDDMVRGLKWVLEDIADSEEAVTI